MHCEANTLRTHFINQTVDLQRLKIILENCQFIYATADLNALFYQCMKL